MNDIVVVSDSVEALDTISSSLCPIQAEWSGIIEHRMTLVSQDSATLDFFCVDCMNGTRSTDPAEEYILRCMKAFQISMQEERGARIRFAASDAIYYIEDGILTVAQVKAAVQGLADRREELATSGVHPLDLVSDAEVAEFCEYLDAALKE